MDLPYLEDLLGVKYDRTDVKIDIDRKLWKKLNEKVDHDGKTLLMQAAERGALECIDLLLRCGLNVNACREVKVDNRGTQRRRAIDYSVIGNHSKVSCLLLEWDSYLPNSAEGFERMDTLLKDDVEIKTFFTGRDVFHEAVSSGDLKSIDETLTNSERPYDGPRYWVNSEGCTALYTASCNLKYDTWAYLKSNRFEYLDKETRTMKELEGSAKHKEKFNQAIGKYFDEVDNCHVFKMISRTKVLGREKDTSMRVQRIYEDIDKDPMTSLLLKVLQDEPHFDVILDMRRSDVSCMLAGSSGDVLGLMDFSLDRVYASAGETVEFDHHDVISNLTHELTHKVLHVVFDNGGLPYKKDDASQKEKYDGIIKAVMSSDHFEEYDEIIRRVRGYAEELQGHELIVRVPEMLSKYQAENYKDETQNGSQRFTTEADKLLQFYKNDVMPSIEKYNANNQIRNKMPTGDLLNFPELLCDQKKDDIDVVGMEEAKRCLHNGVGYLKVSNLKLGLSHLGKSLKDIVCVNWSKYTKAERYFQTRLRRNCFTNLVVVWDSSMGDQFCDNGLWCKHTCPARVFESHKQFVTLVIPKDFQVPDDNFNSVDYCWSNISVKTKEWMLEKKVEFQGKSVSLREMLESVTGGGGAEGEMDTLLTADDLSVLIDQEKVTVGRPMESILDNRKEELLRNHPKNFIPRRVMVRSLELNKEVFEWRKRDAFFVDNCKKRKLEKAGFDEVIVWNGERIPDGTRCFILGGEWNDRYGEKTFAEISRKLKELPLPEKSGEWQFAHFFKHEYKKFKHFHSECVHSNRSVILAAAPGSGKSVFVNAKARKEKDNFPEKWIEVVELTQHENEIKALEKIDFAAADNMEDLIFRLINGRGSERIDKFEKEVFKLFCRTRDKVCIFFDGFDEICPDYKETVSSFLKSVLDRTGVRFHVTTRTHECADLEKCFSTLANNLVPIDRKEQEQFLNKEWNSFLRSLPEGERKGKLEAIKSSLRSCGGVMNDKEKAAPIRKLESMSESTSTDVDFQMFAEKMLENGESGVKGEGAFLENALHLWMAAFVAFESNFRFSLFASQPKLYKLFIEMKIDLYLKEKAKSRGIQAGDTNKEFCEAHSYMLLKKYAAFLFLRNEENKLEYEQIRGLMRIGLVHLKEGSFVFIHGKFAEYLFSLWLLDGAKEENVAKVWLTQVLIENEFEKVRQFLDGMLLSDYETKLFARKEGGEWVKHCINQHAFPPEKFIKSIQKCLLQAITERNGGLFQYLAESSGECVQRVIFGETDCNIKILEHPIPKLCRANVWNIFTLCGECIRGGEGIHLKINTTSRIEYLKFLLNILKWVEERKLTGHLEIIISHDDLWWVGFYEEDLWMKEKGKEQLEFLLDFLMRNRAVLCETLKTKLRDGKCEDLFANAAVYAFETCMKLLTSLLQVDSDDLRAHPCPRILSVENKNIVRAWTAIAEKCGAESVQQAWDRLKPILQTQEKRKEFLRNEDSRQWNALFSAFCNRKDPNVIHRVWTILETEFSGEECKALLLDTYYGGKDYYYRINGGVFLSWVFGLSRSGFLEEKEVLSLLTSKDEWEKYYLLYFDPSHQPPPPATFSKLQKISLSKIDRSEHVVSHMKRHYCSLSHSCLDSSSWIGVDAGFDEGVEGEFKEAGPSILSCQFVSGIHRDGGGSLPRVWNKHGERVRDIQLRAYLVLLKGQLEIEKRLLDTQTLVDRLRGEWRWMFRYFPYLQIDGDGGEEQRTREPLVLLSFAAISGSLNKKEMEEVLLSGQGKIYGTAFQWALIWSDPRAFLALYDIARWLCGQDALWKVHAVAGRWERDNSVFELLLNAQEKGLFKYLQRPSESCDPQRRASDDEDAGEDVK